MACVRKHKGITLITNSIDQFSPGEKPVKNEAAIKAFPPWLCVIFNSR